MGAPRLEPLRRRFSRKYAARWARRGRDAALRRYSCGRRLTRLHDFVHVTITVDPVGVELEGFALGALLGPPVPYTDDGIQPLARAMLAAFVELDGRKK